MTRHQENCNAAICRDDPNPNFRTEVAWRPGEEVCKKVPYDKFQLKQLDINKWVKKGMFKNLDKTYTAHDLETKSI